MSNRITYQSCFLYLNSGTSSDIIPVARTQSSDVNLNMEYAYDEEIDNAQYDCQISNIETSFSTRQIFSNFNFLNLVGITNGLGTGYYPILEDMDNLDNYRNFYLWESYNGNNVINNDLNSGVISYFSECLLNKFSLEISLGNPIYTEFTFDSLNYGLELSSQNNTLYLSDGNSFSYSLPNASGYYNNITAFLPGNISLIIPTSGAGIDFNEMHIQSISLNLSIERSREFEIASKAPTQRFAQYPIATSLKISAIVKKHTSENIYNKFNSFSHDNFIIDFYDCNEKYVSMKCENGKLISKSSSVNIEDAEKIDLEWIFNLGESNIEHPAKISFAFLK